MAQKPYRTLTSLFTTSSSPPRLPTVMTMATTAAAPARAVLPGSPDRWLRRGLVAVLLLMTAAMAIPAILGWNVHVRSFPPLHAEWMPRLGPGSIAALGVAVIGWRQLITWSDYLPWPRLLAVSYGLGLSWMLSLAFVDGAGGIGTILDTDYEYLNTARATTDLPATLGIYVERIPFDAPLGNWPVHIAGHPPGALTFFVVLDRLGLGNGFAAGMVVTLIAASTAVAVLLTVRLLAGQHWARRSAPFLVLGPAAIWQAVSADAMFAATAAWGMFALALSARRAQQSGSITAVSGRRSGSAWLLPALISGGLLGFCVMLSYGLPLLGILAITVLWLGGSWRPLIPAILAALAVVLAYAAFGFYWWEALGVLHERYWDGVASRRPPTYWMWGNLAAFSFSAGPAIGVGLAAAMYRWRSARRDASAGQIGTGNHPDSSTARALLWLVLAGVAMVAAADVSQMSRAEVERIWLPFVPWVLLSCALLPDRWRRPTLALQIGSALVIQHLLATGW